VQRVKECSVTVDDRTVGEIGKGLLVYLGVCREDGEKDLEYIADKVTGLRIFEDDDGKMNLSVGDIGGELLVVSQFTLCADTRKGKRPSYNPAAPPELGEQLYNRFVEAVRERGFPTATGEFGAMMQVRYINEGPVTILLDSAKQF
jgi:D-tyrosyl-tRNA(Tyr) deacylase